MSGTGTIEHRIRNGRRLLALRLYATLQKVGRSSPEHAAGRAGAPLNRKLRRLVYRSDSLIDHGDTPGLDAIFRASLRNNRRDRITGALALPDGKFVQVIEGRPADVNVLMVRLRADRRHENLVVLGEWPITARLFAGWAMARPDPEPLGEQAFRIVTGEGSGVQVVDILLGLSDRLPETLFQG